MKKSGRDISRRQLLQWGAAALGAGALVGCGDDTSAATDAGRDAARADAGRAPDAARPDAASPDAGSPDATLAPDAAPIDAPPGTTAAVLAQIDTIVVLCMENRSFDHYLGSLKLREGRVVDGLTGSESNPAPSGPAVPVFNLQSYTPADPPHDWDPAHQQWNGGTNSGFVVAHSGADQNDVMGYYVRSQLPVTYALADGAAICDRYFASVMGPTWPNRFHLHGATSKGIKTNVPALGFDSIWAQLDAAGISNKNYYSDLAWATGGYGKLTGLDTLANFLSSARAGTLPQYSLIDPGFVGGGANDDHPSHDVRMGQALIATVFRALAESPHWPRCLFVLTYDEHGGFYDHVAPPTTVDARPGFEQLGFRVPALVAGPFVKRGVCSTVFDHVSVLSTLTNRFGLPPLNPRVSATNDLSSCLEPLYQFMPQSPPDLPTVNLVLDDIHARFRDPRRDAHDELWQLAEAGAYPRHLDGRADSYRHLMAVLAEGERLGAVRVR